MDLAIVGGTGVYNPEILIDIRNETVATPYGNVELKIGCYKGKEVAFLARHGWSHSVPPHKVNYRANIWALREIGAVRVIATSAVGSLRREMQPGDFVVLDQFLDFTKSREGTFFEGGEKGFEHLDYTEPYCSEMRQLLISSARALGYRCHERGCYVCTEGPRFETAAEIRAFAMLGGDVVGMTNVPEVVLAREAGLCYGVVAMVTNYAAGISPSPLTHKEVVEVMEQNSRRLGALLMRAIDTLPAERHSGCGR